MGFLCIVDIDFFFFNDRLESRRLAQQKAKQSFFTCLFCLLVYVLSAFSLNGFEYADGRWVAAISLYSKCTSPKFHNLDAGVLGGVGCGTLYVNFHSQFHPLQIDSLDSFTYSASNFSFTEYYKSTLHKLSSEWIIELRSFRLFTIASKCALLQQPSSLFLLASIIWA